MLQFNITSLKVKGGIGLLISGELKKGTLKKGSSIYLHDSNGKFLQKCTISLIFNNGKTLTSFDGSEKARRLQIVIEEMGVDLKPNQRFLDSPFSETKPANPGFIGFADPKVVPHFDVKRVASDFIDPLDFFKPSESTKHIWRSNTYNSFGISLQGGGLKGAFGVGALKFLQTANILDGKKNLHLSSASTGSLTSVLLAENSPESIDKAIAQYTDLEKLEDMFTLRPKVKSILNKEPTLKKAIIQGLKKGGTTDVDIDLADFGMEKLKKIVKNTVTDTLTNPLSFVNVVPVAGFNFVANFFEEVDSVKKNLTALSKVKMSLATLDPVINKLSDDRTGVNKAKLSRSIKTKKVTLKMAVTCLNSGATCYITEDLKLMYPKKGVVGDGYDYTDFDSYPITSIGGKSVNGGSSESLLKLGLVTGAITSGAFPALFEPQWITYTTRTEEKRELFNDGGIRENLPINVLKEEQVKNIMAIYCSPIDESEKENDLVKNFKWTDVVQRTMSLIDSENARNDISSGVAVNTSLHGDDGNHNVLHIAPTTGTVGLTEIHPYNIQATIWYGYLRAYDEVFLSDFKTELGDEYQTTKIALRENSEDIFLSFRLLGLLGSKVIGDAGYRVPIKKGHSNLKYVMWRRKHGRLTLQDGTKLDIRGLNNDDVVKFIAFEYKSVYRYLETKKQLLSLLSARLDLIKRDPNHGSSFMNGPNGFMRKAIFADWFGVYDHLDFMRIAGNKRERLKQKYRSISLLNKASNPLYWDDIRVFGYPKQKAPKRFSQKTSPAFKFLVDEVLEGIDELEKKNILFDGSYSDKLISDVMFPLSSDNAMIAKDKTYFV